MSFHFQKTWLDPCRMILFQLFANRIFLSLHTTYTMDAFTLQNYKSIVSNGGTLLNTGIPITEQIVSQLNQNKKDCFGDRDCDRDYFTYLVSQLHNDYEYVGATSKRRKRLDLPNSKVCSMFGTLYEPAKCDALYGLKNRWEMYVFYTHEAFPIASCFVHFNDIYKTCEFHEVCVGLSHRGKGLCKKFLRMVVQHIKETTDTVEVRIFCEKANVGACSCYQKLDEYITPVRIQTAQTTGFIYHIYLSESSDNSTVVGGKRIGGKSK
jgi:hypothetical protein